ncbi:MAG: IS4 family transposase [Alphaproteobacteria bacterium]|nr:IS4 family transposase [Alphaproteobacteria bacterium]
MEPLTPHQQLETAECLAWISARVSADANLTRYRLAKEVCERFAWQDARGRLKEMSCRKRLIALERRGKLVLPAARREPPLCRPDQTPAPIWPEVSGPLSDLGVITLQPVDRSTPASKTWRAMMVAHHPLGAGPLCGAQIRYLIISEHHGALGGVAVSAAAWRVGARDQWLGWDDATRREQLQGVVCNSRFLILPTVRVKHLGSHVLGQLACRIAGDWHQRYGTAPWLMETYVEATRSGTVYRAANWIEVGMTTGRGRQDRAGKGGLAQKRVFVYPLSPARLKRLCGPPAPSLPGWVRREFGGAKLGDRRLERRLLDLAGAFFAKPQANIPQACGTPAAAKAAYRFFDHDRVTMDAVLEPHHQATIDRMRRQSVVLVAQDSSSLCYTMHPEMQGLGPISNRVTGPQGLMVHSALAFGPDGLPLGLLDIECWARDPSEFGKRKTCNAKPIEIKESFKWIRALTPIGNAARCCPGTRIITLADREADIFEYMLEARTRGLEVVVRAKEKKRTLKGEIQHLGMHMHLRPKAGTIELQVPRHGRQPARTAELSVRFDEVTLRPPCDKPDLAPIRMWAVLTREEAPPKDVKAPLEWLLLTTVPVISLVNAIERVQWYTRRWGIEVFHRILKSGCQIEDRQLGTADRLEACLAIDAVVAWRIHYLTWLGRATPDLPCTVAFEEDQWKAVIVFKTRKPPPVHPPSLRQMIRSIAQLGGFLARKADGEPGTQTLWRGLQRMDDITAAFRSFRTAYAMPP